MKLIDYIIVIIVSVSCVGGLIHGFIYEIFKLAIWGFAFFFTKNYYNSLSFLLNIFENTIVQNGTAILVIFVTTLIIGKILLYLVNQIVEKIGISKLDRVLGIFFGLLRGLAIVATIIFVLETLNVEILKNIRWEESKFVPYINLIIQWVLNNLKISC